MSSGLLTLTKEDKIKICARVFFADNFGTEEGYEDYHEALAEFSGSNAPNERFMDFTIEPYIKLPKEGERVFMSKDGQVGTVRMKDGFFTPRTPMLQTDVEKMEQDFHVAMENNKHLSPLEILFLIGWKELV